MDYSERETAESLELPKAEVGEWYLRGFLDARQAQPAVIPVGPAEEPYKKGYLQGLAVAQRILFHELGISAGTADSRLDA